MHSTHSSTDLQNDFGFVIKPNPVLICAKSKICQAPLQEAIRQMSPGPSRSHKDNLKCVIVAFAHLLPLAFHLQRQQSLHLQVQEAEMCNTEMAHRAIQLEEPQNLVST